MIARTLVVVSCAVVLTGCGQDRPGAAAVVDGTTITMREADRTAEVFCKVSLLQAQQQGVADVDNAEVRRQAVSELVTAEIADDVARREGIAIRRSDYAFTAAERDQVAESLPGVDLDTVIEVLEASQRTFAIAEALGERATGEQATEANAADVQQAGRTVLAAAQDDADVRIDPRFGLSDEGEQIDRTLSVSADVLGEDEPASVPATQRCA